MFTPPQTQTKCCIYLTPKQAQEEKIIYFGYKEVINEYLIQYFFILLNPEPHSDADESCKKHMERLLNIWKERNLYRSDFIQQLKLAIEDSNSPRPPG